MNMYCYIYFNFWKLKKQRKLHWFVGGNDFCTNGFSQLLYLPGGSGSPEMTYCGKTEFNNCSIQRFTFPFLQIINFFAQVCIGLSSGTPTWRDEYRRLSHHVPQHVDGEEFLHDGGVSHVAFSSDGSLFATCGQDARLVLNLSFVFYGEIYYLSCEGSWKQINVKNELKISQSQKDQTKSQVQKEISKEHPLHICNSRLLYESVV